MVINHVLNGMILQVPMDLNIGDSPTVWRRPNLPTLNSNKKSRLLNVASAPDGVISLTQLMVIGGLHVGFSKNRGTPKSSMLIGFSMYKLSILGYTYFWKHPCIFSCRNFGLFGGTRCDVLTCFYRKDFAKKEICGEFLQSSKKYSSVNLQV